MRELLSKGKEVLDTDGLGVFVSRVVNYSIVKLKRLFFKSSKSDKRWKSLKGKYAGERIFILGNGPSLNKTPLHLLKGEYTMTFNRINLMMERLNWVPDFYVLTDDLLIQDMHSEIKQEILPKIKFGFFPDLHPSNVNFKKLVGNHDNVYYLHTDNPGFFENLPQCGINKTVVNAGLQIANYLGFESIYLIGVDLDFGPSKVDKKSNRNWVSIDDDDNHFDPRYFGKGRSFHNPSADNMMKEFENASRFFKNQKSNVFNAGIGGKLECFERVSFRDLFVDKVNLEIEIFSNKIYDLSGYQSLDDFEKDSILVTEDHVTMKGNVNYITSNLELVSSLIKKNIFTHIPIGPYDGKYYFIKREK